MRNTRVRSPGPSAPTPAFVTSVDQTGRFFLDQFGRPIFIIGDSSWDLLLNVSVPDALHVLSARAAQGFNANILNLVGSTYEAAQASWATFDGVVPFYQSDGVTLGTGPANYDVRFPNMTYWARADSIATIAAANGITLSAVPLATACYQDNPTFYGVQGQAKLNTFATFLANRYKARGNMMWLLGDDLWPSLWATLSNGVMTMDAAIVGMAQSIVSAQPGALLTCESNDGLWFQSNNPNLDLTTDNSAAFTNGAAGGSTVHVYNTVYDNRPGGPGTNSSPDYYRAYNLSPAVPFVHGEGQYENGTGGKGASTVAGSQQLCRAYAWCALCCGAAGFFYGDTTVWFNGTGWQSLLSEPGQAGITLFATWTKTVAWWRLVPDQTASFVTTVNGSAPSAWASGLVIGLHGAVTGAYGGAAALAYTGELGVVYCHQNDNLAVAMGNMRGTTLARWLDPTTGTYTTIGTFPNSGTQTFRNVGANNAGQSDWVLVLTA